MDVDVSVKNSVIMTFSALWYPVVVKEYCITDFKIFDMRIHGNDELYVTTLCVNTFSVVSVILFPSFGQRPRRGR